MLLTIHGRIFKDEYTSHIKDLFIYLSKIECSLVIQSDYYNFLVKKNILTEGAYKKYTDKLDYPSGANFHLSLGGDGTLLESVTHICEKQTPMLGINVGRLGYLAPVSPKDIIHALNELFSGNYTLEKRTLIHIDSDKDIFSGLNFGLNELAILKRDTSSMIIVHTYLNNEFLNSYWADGLLISTPTGSTGYSLSCGGPVLMPQSNSFIITPVSPHNLNVRPMIVSDDVELSFDVEIRAKKFLVALDARSVAVGNKTKLTAKKEKFNAVLVNLNSVKYLNTLRSKLNWGLDIRN
ncbi:MAG: NAD kinase [Cytophagales bacterium]